LTTTAAATTTDNNLTASAAATGKADIAAQQVDELNLSTAANGLHVHQQTQQSTSRRRVAPTKIQVSQSDLFCKIPVVSYSQECSSSTLVPISAPKRLQTPASL
jgi:hypothetical protein